MRRLEQLDLPYLLGSNVFEQARIAAQLGDCERSVRFLREALRRGNSIYDGLRLEDPAFARLRACAEFRRLAEEKP